MVFNISDVWQLKGRGATNCASIQSSKWYWHWYLSNLAQKETLKLLNDGTLL